MGLLLSIVSVFYAGIVHANNDEIARGEARGAHHLEAHPNMDRRNLDHRGVNGYHPEARGYERGVEAGAAGAAIGGAASGAPVEVVPEYPLPTAPVVTPPPQ